MIEKAFVHRYSAASCWAQAADFHHALSVCDGLLDRADLPERLRQRIEAIQAAVEAEHNDAGNSIGELKMEVHELVIEMKLLERRMTLYEEKYGVLSEDFYAALMAGELAEYDAHDESRADFSRWKGIYETWRRRKEAYQKKLQERELVKLLRFQPVY